MSEPDVLGDLEAELLSDLQASFAAVKEAIEVPKEPVQAAPPPAPKAPPSPQAAAAPPPPPRPASSFEPVRPPKAEAAAPEQHASRPQPGSPQQHSAPQQHAAPPPQQPAHPRVSAAARPPLQQVPPHQPSAQSAPAVAPPREHPHAPPPASVEPAGLRNVEVANFAMRPTTAPTVRVIAAPPRPAEKPAPAAAKPTRWDKPAEPPKQQAGAPSRFAPPRAANAAQTPSVQPPLPADTDGEEDLPFGEGLPFAHESGEAGDEFPLDAFDMVPGYGDDTEVPPYPDDELEPLRKRGVPRSLVVVAGILALVLIGILAVVMLRPNGAGSGTPPIIAADAGPTKIAPPEAPAASDGDQQNKLIYDRVDSASGGAPANTKLVTPGSEPIAPVPQTDNNNNPIARVIMPGGPAPEAPGAADAGNTGNGGANVATNEADGAQSIGPRKVRTVVVRPDGTIVSSDAVPAPGDAPASVDATPAPASAAQAPTAQVPPVPPLPTNDDTAAIAGGKSGQELPITAGSGPAANPADTAANQPDAPAVPAAQRQVPTPTPTPPPQPKAAPPKVVATGGDRGPIDLTPGTSSTQVASAAPGGQGAAAPLAAGGMMVQISSQRTQDAAQATFRDLRARYSGVLGGYQANIQKADLGDRGTYYRVRVGPFAAADAQSVCGALKNAGGDCVLSAR